MKKNLFIVLIIASTATALTGSVISYRNAVNAAGDFLKSQALVIASSLDTAISRYGTEENVLPDIIRSGKWEGIAFLALYAADGLTVLHSNESLMKKKIADRNIITTAASGDPVFRHLKLGTGEEVFVLDSPVQLGGAAMVLRVALHTYPARAIVRGAKFQLFGVLGVISVLSAMSGFFFMSARRREELEKVFAEKEKLLVIGEMASVLAHEIRNPLGSIKGFAQYLMEQTRGGKPRDGEVSEQYLSIIVSESKRIETLTEELLDYAKQDEPKAEDFDLPALIKETLYLINVPPRISVTVSVPDTLFLFTDRNKVRQIIANLMQNAIEAVPGEGKVAISAEEKGEFVLLRISDSGVGIDAGALTDIFKPFHTTKAKGTGLGLAVVERNTRVIGGKIDVESGIGKGSSFSIRMPKRIRNRHGQGKLQNTDS
jgi:two-component system sensor histidine kinase HydH